ncbi:MAG: VWA domain-containing protein, partial [Candidatus Bipolaricaulota bacterium]
MILTAPAYLYLLLLALGVVLLHLLRTRQRGVDVTALFLWDDLPRDPRAKAAVIRLRIDSLLLLQLLTLAAIVLALVGPSVWTRRPSLSGLALVVDGSASVRARAEDGGIVADDLREAALALLALYPSTPVAVLEMCSAPRVLAALSRDHETARRALETWEPTWFANGSRDDLGALLESQGESLERIVYLTDEAPPFSWPGLEVVTVPAGQNVALTAFSVREDPRGIGVVAFARLRNDTRDDREIAVVVSDGEWSTQVAALIAPGEEQALVLPFPASRGRVFTATLDLEDAFAGDNLRTWSLPQRGEWKVRILGEMDRFVRAALTSVEAVRLLGSEAEEPDLTVVCGVEAGADVRGSVLLVGASLRGVVEVGDAGCPRAQAHSVERPQEG